MATSQRSPGSHAGLREESGAPASVAPSPGQTTRAEAVRLETMRLETMRVETMRVETVRAEAVRFDTGRIEAVTRVKNPFARFRSRSQWLSTMIRAGREANPAPRDVPEWFNR